MEGAALCQRMEMFWFCATAKGTVDQKAHHQTLECVGWATTNEPVHLSESSLADTIFSTRGEGTTVNPRINFAANQSERGVYEKNISPDYAEMDEGSPCFRRVNRLVSLRKRRPINSKWTPIKRDDQKFNGTEMLARVTFYHRREEFHRLNILYRWFFI